MVSLFDVGDLVQLLALRKVRVGFRFADGNGHH